MSEHTTVEPRNGHVLIRPKKQEETTASGLVIPSTATSRPEEGTVIAVGPGEWHPELALDGGPVRVPIGLAVGDLVVFQKYAGTDYKHDGEELQIINEKAITAVVRA